MLPFDKIKIDRSFVQALGSDPDALKYVRGIISLANSLELPVVAEGIETPAVAQQLRALGCDHGQGFYLGRPMCGGKAAAFIADPRPPLSMVAPATYPPPRGFLGDAATPGRRLG